MRHSNDSGLMCTKLKMDHVKTLLKGQSENPHKDVTNIQCQTNSGKAYSNHYICYCW